MSEKAKTVDDYTFSIKGHVLVVTPSLCASELDASLALALSIKKHRFIVEHKQEMESVHDGASHTCALCQFNADKPHDCLGCIVGQATEKYDCGGTPYWDGEPEDEVAFLLALQKGGVEAGRDWLKEWNASRANGAS